MPKIDPWSSEAITDYEHIFKEFGLERFPEQWKQKLEKNHLFRRGVIIAHRDFGKVMKRIEEKKPFINMTGIASSGRYHLGHKVDIDLFLFFKSLGAKNYFCISDIDAYCSRPDDKVGSMEKAKEIAVQNTAHALALGLDEKDIYVQSNYKRKYYEFTFELSKKITGNTFEAVYGHVDLGKISAAILQYADILHAQLPEFEGMMPSITGIGLDQDPHARLARDIAKRLPYKMEMPSFIYFRHQSGLKEGTKMSSSDPFSAIFLDDSEEDIERKIKKAFSGGKDTAEEQRKNGANPDICKVCELLTFHLDDDKKLQKILEEQRSGKELCGPVKEFAAEFLIEKLKKHQVKVKQNLKKAEKIVFG